MANGIGPRGRRWRISSSLEKQQLRTRRLPSSPSPQFLGVAEGAAESYRARSASAGPVKKDDFREK